MRSYDFLSFAKHLHKHCRMITYLCLQDLVVIKSLTSCLFYVMALHEYNVQPKLFCSNVVIRYDPRLNSFLQLSSMKDRRGDFVAFPHDDRIFVFGGRNKTGGLKSCECYNVSSNTWNNIADLPEVSDC